MTKRILVVDDDDGVREIVQFSLEAVTDWEIVTAASGVEAVAIATASTPDAILLDVMMPEEDGFVVFQKLQANPLTQSIPTIMLTAKARMSERQQIMELGVVGLITKPFQVRELVTQIQQLLGWDLNL